MFYFYIYLACLLTPSFFPTRSLFCLLLITDNSLTIFFVSTKRAFLGLLYVCASGYLNFFVVVHLYAYELQVSRIRNISSGQLNYIGIVTS